MADFFELKNNGSDVKTELLAGATTFLSGMYIIFVNPAILKGAGVPFNAALTATVLVSAFSSILMGLYSNNPILVAPGMSLNYLFVQAVTRIKGISYESALGCVFYAGLIYLLLMVVDRRRRLLSAVPPMLRYGLAGGIGLFIAVIGLESSGFVPDPGSGTWTHGRLNAVNLTFILGFLITSILVVRKIRGSFVFGILIVTLLSWPIGRWWGDGASINFGQSTLVNWRGWFAPPDFSLFLRLDLAGALRLSHWTVIFVFLFTCLFDGLSTLVGVCEAGDLVDEAGEPRNLVESLKVNSAGLLLSGLLGTSPATSYIESATGVREGGRTGLSAVVSGLLFIPFLFFSPLLSLVPALATAPILVLAGVFMLKPLIYVRWERFDEAIPFFMAMIVMPLSHSITQGIIWGCLSWTVLKAAGGKIRQVPAVLILIDIMALLLLFTLNRQF